MNSPQKRPRRGVAVAAVFSLFFFFSCASAPKGAALQASSAGNAYERASGAAEDRMVAYSASLRVEVDEPKDAKALLLSQTRAGGGFVTLDTEEFLTVRIPVEQMDFFLDDARKLGKVKSEQIIGRDITESYTGNVIRLDSLKRVRDRYEELLAKALDVADMIAIEKELERINVQIDQLEGQKQSAELSVQYANITVYFGKEARPGPLGWIFYGLYRGIKWLFVWS